MDIELEDAIELFRSFDFISRYTRGKRTHTTEVFALSQERLAALQCRLTLRALDCDARYLRELLGDLAELDQRFRVRENICQT
jgi:hypothetical protein